MVRCRVRSGKIGGLIGSRSPIMDRQKALYQDLQREEGANEHKEDEDENEDVEEE